MPPATQTENAISDNLREILDKFEKDVERVELILELNEYKKKTALYEQRRKIIKPITKFWLTALKNNHDISEVLQHDDDLKALDFLTDIWIARDPNEPRAYTIEFAFDKNPYFEDKVLKKVFKYTEPSARKREKMDAEGFKWEMLDFDWDRDVKPQATRIQWKSGKNLCRKHPREGDDDSLDELGSFFNWFELPHDSFEIGTTIADDIFPDAISYFLNEVDSDDEWSDNESDSDDDNEDDNDGSSGKSDSESN